MDKTMNEMKNINKHLSSLGEMLKKDIREMSTNNLIDLQNKLVDIMNKLADFQSEVTKDSELYWCAEGIYSELSDLASLTEHLIWFDDKRFELFDEDAELFSIYDMDMVHCVVGFSEYID